MTDDTREYLLKTAMDVKYLVREIGHDKKYIAGTATEFNTCKDDRYLMLSCLLLKSGDEKITDIETLEAKLASDEKVMTHVFATFIPCYSVDDVLDLGWKGCKDFKFDKLFKGYTFRLCDL